MARCCICNEAIDSDNPDLLSAAISKPLCRSCSSLLSAVRFGTDKDAARGQIQYSMKSNPSISADVKDYLCNNMGVDVFDAIDPSFMTSGYGFEGFSIVRYLGMVSGDYVLGTGFVSSAAAGISDIAGTESASYAEKLTLAKAKARGALAERAAELKANAIIGVDYDVFTVKGLLGFSANGTAVVIEPKG